MNIQLNIFLYFILFFVFVQCKSEAKIETPSILYTDVISGPNVGGENNQGTYISIFGNGFGKSTELGKKVKVYINNIEVAAYHVLEASFARKEMQKLVVQPGNDVKSGSIKVVVDGIPSNTNHTFTITSGDIYYVSKSGRDTLGKINDINNPFRTVHATWSRKDFGDGDVIVIREGIWSDEDKFGAFLTLYNKTGVIDNPMVVTAYPGEIVRINTVGKRGGIATYLTKGGIVISNLQIDGNGNDLMLLDGGMNNVRIVNNKLHNLHKNKPPDSGTAAICGNGENWKIFGNLIYDIGDDKYMHGIYIDSQESNSNDIEIAFNNIHDISGGRGIQLFWHSGEIKNIDMHNNLIYDVDRDGIVVSNASAEGIEIWDNVIYNVGRVQGSTIRVRSNEAEVNIFNNTLLKESYLTDRAILFFEEAKNINLINNIIYTSENQRYIDNQSQLLYSSNNLWFGNSKALVYDNNPIEENPFFMDKINNDFTLYKNSPAIDKGISQKIKYDFLGNGRQDITKIDIGAFEYVDN